MKLNFGPNQEYQLDAIKAVIDVFEGQALNNEQLSLNNDHYDSGVFFIVYSLGKHFAFLSLIVLDKKHRKNTNLANNLAKIK